MEKKEEEEEREGGPKEWDCGSPLYDAYELVSLANIIERHMMTLPWSSGLASSSLEEETAMKKKKEEEEEDIIFHKRRKMEKAKGFKSRFYSLFSRIGLMKK
ncbi:hypothetical protein Pfo_010461 [Paulownia fortunei]|nr:hypothetical protein Pfo_010461 [Paulownia fortunei]